MSLTKFRTILKKEENSAHELELQILTAKYKIKCHSPNLGQCLGKRKTLGYQPKILES